MLIHKEHGADYFNGMYNGSTQTTSSSHFENQTSQGKALSRNELFDVEFNEIKQDDTTEKIDHGRYSTYR